MTLEDVYTLYTMDDCVFCQILKSRLSFEKIDYLEINDTETIQQLGFETVPRLMVDGKDLDFNQSVAWLNSRRSK